MKGKPMNMQTRLITELQKLMAFQPVTADTTATAALIDYVRQRLETFGMLTELRDNNGFKSLVAGTKSLTRSALLLQAHIDVVPASPELFVLQREVDILKGRGTYDMLFGTAAYVVVLENLAQTGTLPLLDLGFILASDEETGGHNSSGPQLDNYVCDVCFLPDAGGKDQLSIGAKGVLNLKVTVQGKSGHAARPTDYRNPIYDMATLIHELHEAFPNSDPQATTCSLTKLQSGDAINQVAALATLMLDIRFTPDDEPDDLQAKVAEVVVSHNTTVERTDCQPGFEIDFNHPELQKFARLYQTDTGRIMRPMLAPGSTDGRFLAARGIPVIMLRPDGGNLHGADEFVSLASLVEFTEVLQHYITDKQV